MRIVGVIQALLVVAWLVMTGCGGKKAAIEPPEPEILMVTVPRTIDPNFQPSDEEDPIQLIQLGLVRFRKGAYREAGQFLEQAAGLEFPDLGAKRKLLVAAAYCFLMEDQRSDFLRVGSRLAGLATANPSDAELVVQALEGYFRGEVISDDIRRLRIEDLLRKETQ